MIRALPLFALLCCSCSLSHGLGGPGAARDASPPGSSDAARPAGDAGEAGMDRGGPDATTRRDGGGSRVECVDAPPETPVADRVVQVVAGVHTCVRTESGRVTCWGYDEHGQMGRGEAGPPSPPVVVEGLPPARSILGGTHFTCAIDLEGALRCWGSNRYGTLAMDAGLGEMGEAQPITAVALPGPVADACAGSRHVCARLEDRRVLCWGDDEWGQVGVPRRPIPITTPTVVAHDVDALDCGAWASCAQRGEELLCWGARYTFVDRIRHEVDAEVEPPTPQPVRLADGDGFAVGYARCRRTAAGALECWGSARGPLGRRRPEPPDPGWADPEPVRAVTDVVDLDVHNHGCVALASGEVRCWMGAVEGGMTFGQLGHGRLGALAEPRVSAIGVCHARHVSVGFNQTCSWTDDGVVACWGNNTHGGIRLGERDRVDLPLRVWP